MEASEFIRVRLEMKDIGKNQGQGRTCAGCSRETESTEHIMKCQETSDMIGIKGDLMWINGKVEELRKITNFINKYIEKRTKKSLNVGTN